MSKPSHTLQTIRHSAAHLMAAAVNSLYSDVRFDIGPATAEGFYYDFDMPHRLTAEDLPKIEKEMRRLQRRAEPFERLEVDRSEAESILRADNQTYKLERLADIPPGESISFYRCAGFTDLCRGPHVEHTGQIKTFKLLSVAGSYYRGDERNPMLQRIYGTAFADGSQLEEYLQGVAEARRRDHRRLGRELDLFSVSEKVGPGLVMWHPKGARIRHLIESFWRDAHYAHGYELLYTPHIGKANLWQTSGHLQFYADAMYAPMSIDDHDYFVKPMNCPFHIEVYQTARRSYRELPMRWAELGTVYRYEKGGVLHGLMRVRGFTQDDAHIICTPEQVVDEIASVLRFSLDIWRAFGFSEVKAYLATRPRQAVGEEERWQQALTSLQNAVAREELACETDVGGGAFYGPKIDLKIKDALGREWQTTTIQFDFNLPERFDMTYIGSDGQAHRPYMIHRALFGSLERFFGILVEHYGGAFPLWLAPEQVRILPVGENFMDYAGKIVTQLKNAGIRATLDADADTVGAKIRRARQHRLPYMAVVGAREQESDTLSVRSRADGQLGTLTAADLIDRLQQEIELKK